MIKTEFMELLEELDRINEATDKSAERKFWAAAKRKQLDEVSFHAAYDEELKEFGLMDIFNSDGTFTGRSVYGRIKEAKEANPDSWALKALSKLWALRYVDNVRFESEVAAMKAAEEEAEKRRAAARAESERLEQEAKERKAERERLAQEARENTIKEFTRDYKALLPEVLTEIKQTQPDLFFQYTDAYNVDEADFDIEFVSDILNRPAIKILPNKSTYIYKFNDSPINKYKELLGLVYSELKGGVKHVQEAKAKAGVEANKAIDVFNSYKDATAILLGESGKMYFLSDTSEWNLASMADNVSGELVAVKYVTEISEPYKVIYTHCSTVSRSNYTYEDKTSYKYISWDSSEKDKIPGLIPTIGKGDGIWSEWETKAIKSGDGKVYSMMDNIDSWAYTETTHFATD